MHPDEISRESATGPDGPEEVRVFLARFETAEPRIRSVRDAVFGREQNVAPELDWDGRDPDCLHALAVDRAGRPVGTGRLGPDGRIGRLAVLADRRGRGIGRRILETLVLAARSRGIPSVRLHAQAQAIAFYRKCGFLPAGEDFEEAGIPHVRMTRRLLPGLPPGGTGRNGPERGSP